MGQPLDTFMVMALGFVCEVALSLQRHGHGRGQGEFIKRHDMMPNRHWRYNSLGDDDGRCPIEPMKASNKEPKHNVMCQISIVRYEPLISL